jgi:hypothetical protein
MDEGARLVVAVAVVENTGNNINLFRAGLMNVYSGIARAGIYFKDNGSGAISPLPQGPNTNAF